MKIKLIDNRTVKEKIPLSCEVTFKMDGEPILIGTIIEAQEDYYILDAPFGPEDEERCKDKDMTLVLTDASLEIEN